MRGAAALVVIALLAPSIVAAPPWPLIVELSAKMDTVFWPGEIWIPPRGHYVFTLTGRNDGIAGDVRIGIEEWGPITDLPETQWSQVFPFAEGEVRTIVIDLDLRTGIGPFPSWMCATGFGTSDPSRCWSVVTQAPMPDGVYPEDLPHWQLQGVPMGDSE